MTLASASTRVDEIGDRIYRIHTAVPNPGFSFNQYLVDDDEPLLFHTGGRQLFPAVREAISRIMPPERLRWIGFSHVEADECGSLNELLGVAPRALPFCSRIAAMVSVNDMSDRAPRALADGEELCTGSRRFLWLDAPHVPHGWDNGFIFETTTRTLFCGDLLTQPGAEHAPITTGDVLGPSEAMRESLDYFAHSPNTRAVLARLAATHPLLLCCMHGSAFAGDGERVLLALADKLEADATTHRECP